MRCPACGEADLAVFFEITAVPVFCNVFEESPVAARSAPRGDIRLGFCQLCGMIHNVAFDPGLVAYSPEYETSLHFSSHFREFANEIATRLVDAHGIRGKDVVELGCGRGDFLRLLAAIGNNRCVGFDASYDDNQADHRDLQIEIHKDYYAAASHPDVLAHLLVCRHVLEHVEDPQAFLRGLQPALRPSGILYLEVPDAMFTLRDLGIWDIIYEHCSYFTAPTLQRLLAHTGYGLKSMDSRFGGQFLCSTAQREQDFVNPQRSGAESLDEVRARVGSFATEFQAKLAYWSAVLDESLNAGDRIAVWGAGSKGVTFLNTVPRGGEVQAVIDINERKQGRHVVGTGQRVQSPESLVNCDVDLVLVMNPNYIDEIRAQFRQSDAKPRFLAV